MVAGGNTPIRALIEAVGHASSVLINEENKSAVAVPSLVVVSGKDTVVIVGADDALVQQAAEGASLLGAYHNVLSAEGVSAMWNGVIGASSSAAAEDSKFAEVPRVVVGGHAARAVVPNNLANAATRIVFFEKGTAKAPLSIDEAVTRLVALTDESKADLIRSLLKDANLSTAGKVEDVAALLK